MHDSDDPNELGLAVEKGGTSLTDLKKICFWILKALGTMHKHGLVHYDMKPGTFWSLI